MGEQEVETTKLVQSYDRTRLLESSPPSTKWAPLAAY